MTLRDDAKQTIHDVLLNEWDPIGIVSLGGPDDEYQSYEGGVLALLQQGVSEDELAAHLIKIERDRMGLEESPDIARRAARSLIEKTAADR